MPQTDNALRRAFAGRSVLVTGHTGFKGSWLSLWLHELGARVAGYSLDPPTQPNNYELTRLAPKLADERGDVRDYVRLEEVLAKHQPEVIFHLAAQAILLTSYREPKETLDANVGGTINVLEAVRRLKRPCTVVCITSDKCYEDTARLAGCRETDRLGGYDPYSASKGMAELAIATYRNSFFPPQKYEEHRVAVASCRAGNVIGGGDFGAYRLIPDAMRALLAGEAVAIRNPDSVRPWQHVLVPLSGYLWLAAKMQADGAAYSEPWNFGPVEAKPPTTRQIVERLIQLWGRGSWVHQVVPNPKKETRLLRLNCRKAKVRLGWRAAYNCDEALAATAAWFRVYRDVGDLYAECVREIEAYTARAAEGRQEWAK